MNGVSNPTAPVGINPINFDAAPVGPSLSPEMLLAYCSSRLNALDSTIDQYFKDQQTKNAAMKACSALQAKLGRWSSHWDSKELTKPENAGNLQDHANMANDILEVYRSTNDPEVKAACEAAFKNVTGRELRDYTPAGHLQAGNTQGGFVVTAEDIKKSAEQGHIPAADTTQWASVIESVKSVQQGLSKGAEMNMIQLQSLVSQRQLAVQLTTQLMQTIHESSKQIAGNIRA